MCTHCGRNGHTVDACYKKHGYPPGYEFYNGKTGQINTFVTTDEVVSEHSQKKQEIEIFISLDNNIKCCPNYSSNILAALQQIQLM